MPTKSILGIGFMPSQKTQLVLGDINRSAEGKEHISEWVEHVFKNSDKLPHANFVAMLPFLIQALVFFLRPNSVIYKNDSDDDWDDDWDDSSCESSSEFFIRREESEEVLEKIYCIFHALEKDIDMPTVKGKINDDIIWLLEHCLSGIIDAAFTQTQLLNYDGLSSTIYWLVCLSKDIEKLISNDASCTHKNYLPALIAVGRQRSKEEPAFPITYWRKIFASAALEDDEVFNAFSDKKTNLFLQKIIGGKVDKLDDSFDQALKHARDQAVIESTKQLFCDFAQRKYGKPLSVYFGLFQPKNLEDIFNEYKAELGGVESMIEAVKREGGEFFPS